jgi:hypothetical protein
MIWYDSNELTLKQSESYVCCSWHHRLRVHGHCKCTPLVSPSESDFLSPMWRNKIRESMNLKEHISTLTVPSRPWQCYMWNWKNALAHTVFPFRRKSSNTCSIQNRISARQPIDEVGSSCGMHRPPQHPGFWRALDCGVLVMSGLPPNERCSTRFSNLQMRSFSSVDTMLYILVDLRIEHVFLDATVLRFRIQNLPNFDSI